MIAGTMLGRGQADELRMRTPVNGDDALDIKRVNVAGQLIDLRREVGFVGARLWLQPFEIDDADPELFANNDGREDRRKAYETGPVCRHQSFSDEIHYT